MPRSSVPRSSICVWADVGGTFTDVFVVETGGQQRLANKTLSSGLVYATVEQASGNSIRLDKLPASTVAGFWNSAKWHCGDAGGVIRRQNGVDLTLDVDDGDDGEVPEVRKGDSIVIDAQIEAPVLATRILLEVPLNQPLPPLQVRLGTTRGTNALLTRTGARTALVTTKGFGDLLRIGEQDRAELFSLRPTPRDPLPEQTIEIDERRDANGDVLTPINEAAVIDQLRTLQQQGIQSIAICLLHAHTNDWHERIVCRIAKNLGFESISQSAEVAPLIKLLSRAETTSLDAYLNPILDRYVQKVHDQFGPECDLHLMTSNGNLVRPDQFRGRDSVLSGPAGGVVALAKISEDNQIEQAIGLDMGGTSTDVSRYEGKPARRQESIVARQRIMTPMMDIHTVAAGGGSICEFRDGRLAVGPESASASPGPACYGRGGPLTVTDVNLLLGRLPPENFPFTLNRSAATGRLDSIRRKMHSDPPISAEQLAEGFLEIANTHMAEAVRQVSTAEGSDVRAMTLVGFGGAAGGHLCRVANLLGMHRILDHPDASMLSALGMGLADEGVIQSRGVYRQLESVGPAQLQLIGAELQEETSLHLDGSGNEVHHKIEIDLRYNGTHATITLSVDLSNNDVISNLSERFHRQHEKQFGYRQANRSIEIVSLRCETTIAAKHDLKSQCPSSTSGNPECTRKVFADGAWRDAKSYDRSGLMEEQTIDSPAFITSPNSTLIVEAGWQAVVGSGGVIELQKVKQRCEVDQGDKSTCEDPVLLEVITRRLQGIADTMGEVLRRTSISVNVKERRDYSCAVFRSDGSLVANAAHVPVHLGAMGHTVRQIIDRFPAMSPGDCFVTNDPFAGGSHLPDVTLVTPAFVGTQSGANESGDTNFGDRPDFFVASRAHHAEIGGMTPGSMPPGATCLAEEGVVIKPFAVIQNGEQRLDELETILRSGVYPSRNPAENIADLQAQIAAGMAGVRGLQELANRYGVERVDVMMSRLLDVADQQMVKFIASMDHSPRRFADKLDDGAEIAVTIVRAGDRLQIAFEPSPVHPRGYNTTPAIVTAATLYILRCLCDSELPLCDGVLRHVDLQIPTGMLNPPANEDPAKSAAVVAGNVETSQRIVDVLLGAFGAAAASQGTMNNVLLGDETFGYYETIGGGMGATAGGPGTDAVHSHMTNTRITDPEVIESRLPVRLTQFAIRRGSGGRGKHRGGDGLIREFEFLKRLTLSLLTNRRSTSPYAVAGGKPGSSGQNMLVQDDEPQSLESNVTIEVDIGDRLRIETPGGGGFGSEDR